MTNLDEVVQVAKFAHIRDTLLFGHILEDLSHVLRRVYKKKMTKAVRSSGIQRWEQRHYSLPGTAGSK